MIELTESEKLKILQQSGADQFDRKEVVLSAFMLGVNYFLTRSIISSNPCKLERK